MFIMKYNPHSYFLHGLSYTLQITIPTCMYIRIHFGTKAFEWNFFIDKLSWIFTFRKFAFFFSILGALLDASSVKYYKDFIKSWQVPKPNSHNLLVARGLYFTCPSVSGKVTAGSVKCQAVDRTYLSSAESRGVTIVKWGRYVGEA